MTSQTFTVFAGFQAIGAGDRGTVLSILRGLEGEDTPAVLVFDDATGKQVDFDVRETQPPESVVSADPPAQRGPGRPKLGVVGREVTLLPRHWEWLNAQPGGASVALRRLVEQARKDSAGSDRVRQAQEAAFRFMGAVAGNQPGFEEACRSLYARDGEAFEARIAEWPRDVAEYVRQLSAQAFVMEETCR